MVLEGEVDVVLFHDNGSISQIIQVGAPYTGKNFYQRLPEEIYHMLIIRSEFLVFHEITEGPFLRENTIFPEWGPAEQGEASDVFINRIELLIKKKGNNSWACKFWDKTNTAVYVAAVA